MKIFWFDVESSGLNPKENDILTLAGLVEIDGKIERGINLKIQPHNWDNIDDEALKINGLTKEKIKTFDRPEIAHEKLVAFFSKYVDKYDSKDKFQPAGYNIPFDINFLAEFFIKCGDKYFGSWVDYHKLDVSSIVQLLYLKGELQDLENFKLKTVAGYLGISIDAHDAKSDIIATRKVCYKLLERIKYEDNRKI